MNNTLTLRYEYPLASFKAKDPISALTHFIGFAAALIGMPLLLIRAAYFHASVASLVSYSVFMISMVLLYGASSAYHAFHISDRGDQILKKIDHMMIFVLIAGSYTPVCVNVLKGTIGRTLLFVIWGIALLGIVFKALWVNCPKWVSSVIYIAMGWAVIFTLRPLLNALSAEAFTWLLCGGIIYTIGGIIYSTKMPLLEKHIPGFGAHELFHVFVMAGSFCHYMMVFLHLTQM